MHGPHTKRAQSERRRGATQSWPSLLILTLAAAASCTSSTSTSSCRGSDTGGASGASNSASSLSTNGGDTSRDSAGGVEGGTKTPTAADTFETPLPEGHQILFIGGFMSELYEAFSINLERQLNESLRENARALNVDIDLPLDRSLDIPIGDAIADALPWFTLPIKPGGFITFHTQESHFTALGVPHQNLSNASPEFDSSATVIRNAAAVVAFLRQHADDRFIIVTHSKGGLDTLHALLQAESLWGRTVVGWVALQAPFFGSPIADASPATASSVLLDALGGNSAAVDDLKTSTRAEYMRAHADRIASLTDQVPIITAYSTYEASNAVTAFSGTFARSILDAQLVSSITKIVRDNYRAAPLDLPGVIAKSSRAAVGLISAKVRTALSDAVAAIGLMDLTNIYMNAFLDAPNDGLVTATSARLPGARFRKLPLGDHASPVMDVDPLKNFWTVELRNRTTTSLLEEVSAMARERSARGN